MEDFQNFVILIFPMFENVGNDLKEMENQH